MVRQKRHPSDAGGETNGPDRVSLAVSSITPYLAWSSEKCSVAEGVEEIVLQPHEWVSLRSGWDQLRVTRLREMHRFGFWSRTDSQEMFD